MRRLQFDSKRDAGVKPRGGHVAIRGRRGGILALGVCAILGLAALEAVAQPANDNFSSAEILSGPMGSVAGDNTDATAELPGEPNHAGLPAAVSVWYQWTAPADGQVEFDTFGSGFDSVLAVYTGINLSTLNYVTANDDANPQNPFTGPSGVKFNAREGTTYYLAVDGFGGDSGAILLNWAYHSAGVLRFTREAYIYSETENFGGISSTVGPTVLGALITVTRVFGNSGRIQVDYATADDTAFEDLDYVGTSGTLIMENGEMSQSFIVPILYDGGLQQDNRDFLVNLTAASLDPLESADLLPPRIDPDYSSATVTILDFDVDPADITDLLTNAPVANLETSVYRTIEGIGTATVYVLRVGGDPAKTWRVAYSIDSAPARALNLRDNTFSLQAASDYATPEPPASPPPGVAADFTPVSGVITWAANDFNPKPIDIPILQDNLPEFNEDLRIKLYAPGGTDNAIPGNVAEATLTILFDDFPAGALDPGYNPDLSLGTVPPGNTRPGANGTVYDLQVQPDNRTVIAGDFTAYNTVPRNHIARVNTDGSHDGSFNPGSGADAFIAALALEPGGKLIIGGGFTSFNGIYRYHVARLNPDGSLDAAFNPGLGADAPVWAVATFPDGKVIIGGDFTSVNGLTRNHIARLNPDGSVDLDFDPGPGPDAAVNTVGIQPDGKIIIGGDFAAVSGVARGGVARLNPDGTLDPTFTPGAGTDGPVYAVRLQPDGKALIGGAFDRVDLRRQKNLTRLNADGTLDPDFAPNTYSDSFRGCPGADDAVYTITLQTDGKIILGGLFTSINDTRRMGVARLFANGEVDTSFLDPAYNQFAGITSPYFELKNFLFATGLQSDGDLIIGGSFTRVGGGRLSSFIRPDAKDTESHTRAAYRQRNNLARLLGGATTGPGNLGFAYDTYTVDENLSFLFVTLRRTNGSLGRLSANFSLPPKPLGPGAAQSGVDYVYNDSSPTYVSSVGLTRMFSDGIFGLNDLTEDVVGDIVTSGADDVFITIPDDTLVQGNRLADLQLEVPSGADIFYLGGENIPLGGALGRATATLTVVDNDTKPGAIGFSSAGYIVNEGGTNAVITLTRTNGSAGRVTVRFSTTTNAPPPTATPGATNDYTAVNNLTVTFANGQTTRTVTVPVNNDSLVEPDETIGLRLFSPGNGATLGQTNAVLTIIDDDFLPGRLNFSAAAYATNENAGAIILTVTRTGGNLGTLSVQYATRDGLTNPATAGADYVGVTNTLNWNNGDTTPRSLSIPLLDDGAVEPDETFQVRLFNPSVAAALGPQTNAPVTLLNDDFLGTVQFSAAAYRQNENGGPALITVVRTGGSAESIAVNYATSDLEAVAGFDYTPATGTLNFGPGQVSRTFTVPILNNPFADGNRRLALTLANPSPTNTLGFPNPVFLTIVDDESFNEPPGALDTAYDPAAGFNGDVLALALQADGKLVAGGDFTLANGLARNRLARLLPNGALDLTFLTPNTAGANAPVRALASQTDARILVGGDFTTIGRVNRSRLARLNYDGSLDTSFNPGSGADLPVLALAETFVGGQRKLLAGGQFTTLNGVPRRGLARLNDDGTVDPAFDPALNANGTVFALAVYPTNGIQAGKTLIGGDFTAPDGASYHLARLNPDGTADPSFDPGRGPDASVRAIAIQLDGNILIGGSFTNYNGTAMNRFARLLATGSLDTNTFTPGDGANDAVTTITVQGDTRIVLGGQFTRCNGVTRNRVTRLNPDGTADPAINFGAGADNFVAATLEQPDGKLILGGGFTRYDGTPRQRLARIYGGTVAGSGTLEFTAADYSVSESATNAVITVRRRGGTAGLTPGASVSVDVVTSDGTGIAGLHYLGGTNTLDFPEGEVIQTLNLPIIDDFEINPDRTVKLALTNIAPPGTAVLGNQPEATLTIINDDSGISFARPTFTRNENSVDGQATITIVRLGSTALPASVNFTTTTSGTATANADYTPVTRLVEFASGETSQTVTIPIIADTLIEGNETVGLELTNPVGALLLAPAAATLTIVDDDFGPGQIAFASPSYVAAENGGNAVISLSRINGSSGVVSVTFKTSDGTAVASLDYSALNTSVTFVDGETNKNVLIPITDDAFVEGDETFNVTLTNATGGATIIGPNTTAVTILDNDVALSFASPFYVVSESGSGVTLTVLRLGGSNGVATVRYDTANLTATAGTDFGGVTNGLLTFANGETLKTFTLPIFEDTLVEGDESLAVNLSNPSGGVQLLLSRTLVSILDNDTGFALSTNHYSVDEAGNNVTITVFRTSANTGPASVSLTTSNITAVAGADYTAFGGALNFTNGEAVKTIAIPISNDTQVEGDETFQVFLSSPAAGAQLLSPSSATVTIVDNDAGLKFASPAYTVSESGVEALITVVRTSVTNSTVTVAYATSDGNATGGLDYSPATGTLTFNPGVISNSFTVTIIDDTLIEGDETVLLKLSNPSGEASLLNPNAATLSIGDNDGSLILPAGSVLISESGPTNHAIDPGETVTLLFALRNALGTPTTNLMATLLATNGVTAPSAPQNYGALATGGPSVSRSFTFTASGTNGGAVAATFLLMDGSTTNGLVTFNYQLGGDVGSFSNAAPITINDLSPATPYPSVINVAGLGGSVSQVTVTLANLSHPSPDDLDLLLVGPTGQKLVLMSDAGGFTTISNVTLTFDDAAAAFLPDSTPIVSGTNKPTNFLTGDAFPSPAPPSPYGSTLSGFNGSNPNGAWSLYVVDDLVLFGGSIAQGWSVTITTAGTIPAAADLSVTLTAASDPVIVTSNLTYTIVVTNHGPSTATGITTIHTLPVGADFVSASPGQGTVSTNSASGSGVVWSIGTLAKDAVASATIVARPPVVGTASSTSSASAVEADPNPANNTAATATTVIGANADLALAMIASPSPVLFGNNLTYTLLVTNLSRNGVTAPGVTITNTLPPGVSFVSATPPGYIVAGGIVAFTNLASLGSGAGTSATITVRPDVVGTLTNTATCSSGVTDPLKGNNTVTVKALVEAPRLTGLPAGQNLVISWPTNAIGFNLESTTNLNPPVVWTPVTSPAPLIVGDRYVVTLPIGSGNEFFRLRAGFPQLSTSRAGNNLVIAWPANTVGYALERTPSLTPPITWNIVNVPAPVTVGNQKTVTLPIGSGSEFFRLRAPVP